MSHIGYTDLPHLNRYEVSPFMGGGVFRVSALGLLIGLLPLRGALASTSGDAFFETAIRPVLVEQCYQCHSAKAEKLKGDLLLDSRDGLLKGGKHGPVLVPGSPDASKLIEAIRWTNADLKMPPKRQLSQRQVESFVNWIKMGAPDPRTEAPQPAPAPPVDLTAARASWAFGIPRDHPVPSVHDPGWCRSPIDHFILSQLEAKGLRPAPPADRRTLIRRAYFDLIGLPPAPAEVEEFVSDPSPGAFARVVDRLLASPEYGQRWARHWLDVVRYTDAFDSRSIKGDQISPGDISEAWRYRDWVVKAFNEDLPYDQFIMQQIAGDLLPGKDGRFNADGLVATGMYVIGNWPVGDADKEKMMTDIVDDQIDVTARAFLGVTLACARCHDHKFDPFTQKDYYGLAGIFFSSHILPGPGAKTEGSPVLRAPIASPADLERQRQYDSSTARLQKQIDATADEQYTKLARRRLANSDKYLLGAWQVFRGGAATTAAVQSVAKDRQLDAYYLSRWVEYLAPAFRGRPPRRLLTKAVHNVAGNVGVDAWVSPGGDGNPSVTVNSTDKTLSFSTLTLPPKSVAVHPGPTTGVAVGWNSPISGTVQIHGKVIDADPNCGDGIAWRIECCRDRGIEALASGSFPNGGNQEFNKGKGGARLAGIEIKPGDVLQMTVFPKGDYTCDTTVVELEIAQLGEGSRVWNLSRDIVPGALVGQKGNPHPDSFGNPSVWQFFDAGEQGRAATAAPGSALAGWSDIAALSNDSQAVEASGVTLRDTLLALDARRDGWIKAKKDVAALPSPDAKLYAELTDPRGPFWAEARKDGSGLPDEAKVRLAHLSTELSELRKNPPPPTEMTNAMQDGGTPHTEYEGTRDWYVLARGRYDRKGDRVARSLPRLLAGDDPLAITHGSGRLELARWIASPDNPMTAKVMANRIWQHHFGEGIVRTPNNYGKLGTPPSHPDLLDWLALRFVDGGWSIKKMHRMVMLSAAYQQSSEGDADTMKSDPGNLLFGRQNRQRLEAEPLRDALLTVSGTLDPKLDGPATRDLNTPRRTLYLMTVRSDRTNYRMLFDAADPTGIADHRIDSTVAPQALFLLNNPFVLDKAKLLADRALVRSGADDRRRIDWLYHLLYSRPPNEKEIEIGLAALRRAQGNGSTDSTEVAWQAYCQVLLCASEFVYVD